MKVDKILLDEADKVKSAIEIPFENKRMVMQTTPFKGHTLFEINCTTNEIYPAKFEETTAEITGKVHRKIIINENCLYISCLNKKSAFKKYIKWLSEKLTNTK